ncbi:tetratricopeptide repeat-containing sensor histidine kinase [Marinifilum sp. D714]|uniref:ATP-binding protein n=1 Tax=Marinifilum sp. D714 TaxID=2937523 RepID=UPI0027C7DDE6|nr:tetratricopeptide repeat-containing sensor histidine kinase [Marinifilum sp. D714]MDQ2178959.1 tetratricopeptide repeat-containing sensor histidine kinase [Marinifilum sp. D714]
MNKFILLFLLIGLSLSNYSTAQNKVDSLNKLLSTTKDDQKADIYSQLAKEYYYKDLKQLIFYARKADSLAVIYQIDSTRIKALNHLCYAYINSGKRKQALDFNNKALTIAKEKRLIKETYYATYFKGYYYYSGGVADSSFVYLGKAYNGASLMNDPFLKLRCLNIIAANYLNQGDYNKALNKFTCAYHIADSIKNEKQLLNISLNIGTTLLYNEDLEQAIQYFEKVLALSDLNQMNIAVATAYNNIGACYSRMADHEKAISYFEKALPAFIRLNNRFQIAQAYANLGQSNYFLNNIEDASYYLNEAVKINRENNLSNQLIVNLIILARLQIIKKEFAKAKESLQEAKELSKTYNINYNKSDLLKAYSYYYSSVNNFEKALEYKELELIHRDSIFNESKQKQIAELETKFKTQLKEKENENLKKDLSLQQLNTSKQTQIRNFLIAFAFLVIVLIGILLNRARIKKIAHQIIEQQKNELEVSNTTKDKLFSIIAHDLRSPFNTIIGFSDFLHNDYDSLNDHERKLQILDIKNASHSAFNLLENLLTWARIQQGNIKVKPEILPLNKLIETSVNNYMSSAKLKEIELNYEYSNLLSVIADQYSIELILGNLVSNAIKFTPFGGSISISSEIQNDMAVVKVKDSGTGLSDEAAEKIFKKGEAYTSTGTNQEKGSGLGLVLCKEFIEMNGGEIWFCNDSQKGACFAFSFPLYQE